jgi:methyltransferase (TIGR00027 family)
MQLEGVEETLLIPLWARAAETRRAGGLVNDPRAVELVEQIDYDYARLSWDWATQVAVAIRTRLLDDAARAFIARHPDALVINLAAGLDTRFYRLDNGQLDWVDVDLPNSMALRRRFFNDTERHQYVVGSVLEEGWLQEIQRAEGRPVLVIVEGLTMYFTPEETRGLLARLAERFPGGEILLESYSPLVAHGSGLFFRLRGMKVQFRGGAYGYQLAEAHPRLRLLDEWFYFDREAARWGIFAIARLIPPWRKLFKIAHLKIDN